MPIRRGTKARKARQERALERFSVRDRNSFAPKTNRRIFPVGEAGDESYAVYTNTKETERLSLSRSLRL